MVVADSPRSLRLTWEPPLDENRNGIITEYTAFVTVDGGTAMELTTANTSLVVGNLRPFTTYSCSVAASTRVGQGPLTGTMLVTTPEDGKMDS